jgi:hypothetical protein
MPGAVYEVVMPTPELADMAVREANKSPVQMRADSSLGAHLAGNAIVLCRLQEPWLARFLTGTRTASADPV